MTIINLLQQRCRCTLLGELGLSPSKGFKQPTDRQVRIVPPDRPLTIAAPKVGGFVKHLGLLAQGQETVGKARRNSQLLMVAGAQVSPHQLAKGG